MTSLPAQFLGLKDRGLLREGYKADLVVFDVNEIQDNATFENPHQYPSGIHHVIVNGQFIVNNGVMTGDLPGRIIDIKESRRYRSDR